MTVKRYLRPGFCFSTTVSRPLNRYAASNSSRFRDTGSLFSSLFSTSKSGVKVYFLSGLPSPLNSQRRFCASINSALFSSVPASRISQNPASAAPGIKVPFILLILISLTSPGIMVFIFFCFSGSNSLILTESSYGLITVTLSNSGRLRKVLLLFSSNPSSSRYACTP